MPSYTEFIYIRELFKNGKIDIVEGILASTYIRYFEFVLFRKSLIHPLSEGECRKFRVIGSDV